MSTTQTVEFDTRTLENTAREMTSPGKGILAADESTGTIGRRFAAIGVESTEERRRAYRQLLFTAPGLGEHIAGVILFDETIRQSGTDGRPFTEVLTEQGIVPGIKVDRGTVPLPGHPGETVTEGLDGLRQRLAEYRDLGARFAKWRAVIHVGAGIPTTAGIEANAHTLARYAALCQEAGLVPIVEPEVLMDGDHTIERCEEVTSAVLREVFDRLVEAGVDLEGMVLKPNMVIAGTGCTEQASAHQVAEATLRTLRRHVPAAVPGIAFLSGGQTEEQATDHLALINALAGRAPWALTFSYGRALQQSALHAWQGAAANVVPAQRLLLERARANGLARGGVIVQSVRPVPR
jgi:fructose-bisphosphate aldolase class I